MSVHLNPLGKKMRTAFLRGVANIKKLLDKSGFCPFREPVTNAVATPLAAGIGKQKNFFAKMEICENYLSVKLVEKRRRRVYIKNKFDRGNLVGPKPDVTALTSGFFCVKSIETDPVEVLKTGWRVVD